MTALTASAPSPASPWLLEVEALQVCYPAPDGRPGAVPAVRGVSFGIRPGQTVGLVGESGSGKSSIARAIIRLAPISGGVIRWQGEVISTLSAKAFFPYRKRIQMVFQDPVMSLNPRLTVEAIVAEPLLIHFPELDRAARRARVAQLLAQVGLEPAWMSRLPAEFSGGQRQRIGLARALAVEPQLLLCDEAVSALDVSVQAQILNLLLDLQEQLGLALLFISHDLAVVEHVSDTVVVLQHGQIVEQASALDLYRAPQEAYTRELLAAVPQV